MEVIDFFFFGGTIFCLFVLAVPGFELSASHLLGRCSTPCDMIPFFSGMKVI
jgi:hypothetical protein